MTGLEVTSQEEYLACYCMLPSVALYLRTVRMSVGGNEDVRGAHRSQVSGGCFCLSATLIEHRNIELSHPGYWS